MQPFIPDSRTRHAAVATLLALVALAGLILVHLRPPAVVPATAPPTAFSAERAMAHVRALAAVSRPVGSPQHRAAAEYLRRELASLGLVADTQRATVGQLHDETLVVARVENVVGRLLGEEHRRALLLLAHYDSTPQAPGAGDDASGVATILETLRALRATGEPLARDLVVLFTDAEELGLLGAHAFVDAHPWAADIGAVLNFEGRGSAGPSLMFETGHPNRAAIRLFQEVVPEPRASSLTDAVYQRMPNDTDFTVFRRELGLPGLNFAFMEGLTRYHSPLDTPRNLDPRSLQHHGDAALALGRALTADATLLGPAAATGEDVYFDLVGTVLVAYGEAWALPLAILLAGAWLALVAIGRRRGLWTLGGVAVGGGVALVATVLGAGAGTALWWLVVTVAPRLVLTPQAVPYTAGVFEVAVALAAAATTVGSLALARRRAGAMALGAGALGLWAALAVATAVALPGGSYLLLWPALGFVGAWALALLAGRGDSDGAPGAVGVVLLGVAGALAAVLVVPLVRLLFVGLTLHAAGVAAALLVLLLVLLSTPIALAARRLGAVAGGLAIAALALAAVGIAGDRSDAERPRVDHVFYVASGGHEAWWWSGEETLPPHLARLMPEAARVELPAVLGGRESWRAPAPVVELPAPSVKLRGDLDRNGGREVHLRLASERGASVLRLRVATLDDSPLGLAALRVDGERFAFDPALSEVRLVVYGTAEEPVPVVLELPAARSELAVEIADQTWGLPAGLAERPESFVPRPSWLADSTIVLRRRRLPLRRVALGAPPWQAASAASPDDDAR